MFRSFIKGLGGAGFAIFVVVAVVWAAPTAVNDGQDSTAFFAFLRMEDDISLRFGDDDDINVLYDETTDDRLEFGDGTNTLMWLTPAGYFGLQNDLDSTTAYQWFDADGGAPVLDIDTTNEWVGIGTASPGGGPLWVQGTAGTYVNINTSNWSQEVGWKLYEIDNTKLRADFIWSGVSLDLVIANCYANAAADMIFETQGVERLRINGLGHADFAKTLEAGTGDVALTNADGTLILAAIEADGAATDDALTYDGADWVPDGNVTHQDLVATLSANWVNEANPWADNEVSDTLTIGPASTMTAPPAIGGGTPAAGMFTTLSATGSVTSASLIAGINDTTSGDLYLFSQGTGSVDGGEARFYTAADHDGTIEHYRLEASSDDFRIFPSTASWIHWFREDGDVEFAKSVDVGTVLSQNIGTAFPDTDTTPSVADGNIFKCSGQTAPIAITMLDGGTAGQTVTVIAIDADTDMTDGGNLKLAGNWTPDADDTIILTFDGTNWFEDDRSAN